MTDDAKPAAKTKDLTIAQVTIHTKVCYREHKFPEGDPRRDCHFGLQELDLSKCGFCSWLGDKPGAPRQVTAITGGKDIATLADCLNGIKAGG